MHHLTVAEMMTTKIRTLHEDESVSDADWDMVIGGFRHIPVVDGDYRLVGMVSDRDVLRRPERTTSVVSVMTRDVYAVLPTVPAIDAVEHLLLSKHSALPVVDEQRTLVGIVTATDFLELARRALAGDDVNTPHVRA
jgi:CBS domain-containing protein